MTTKARRQRGFLTAELAVATGLLGLLIVGMAVSLGGFSAFNHYLWTRQRCTAAAQAQLDSLVAIGRPIEPQELKRLWPEVDVSLDIKMAACGLAIADAARGGASEPASGAPGPQRNGAAEREAESRVKSAIRNPQSAVEQEFQLLRPEADVAPKAKSGASWEGLKLVEVTAAAPAGAHQVRVRLARYVWNSD